MEEKTNTLLWVAAAAAAVYFIWQRNQTATIQKTAATATMPATTLPSANGTSFVSPLPMTPAGQNPTQMLPVTTTIVQPVAVQPATVLQLPPGISQNVFTVVQNWAQTDGRAPVLQMAAAMIPSEYAGMYDLITNYWDAGVPPGTAQVTFWNNLRAEYDPMHNIW